MSKVMRILALILAFVPSFGCDDDPVDTEPPAPIEDLAIESTTDTSATITWTAPGDESGIAEYDLRFREFLLEESNWDAALQTEEETVPRPAGEQERMTVSVASEGYYVFGVRVCDTAGNWSSLSNVASADVSDNYHWVDLELPERCPLALTAEPYSGFITVATDRNILLLQDQEWVDVAPSPGAVKSIAHFRNELIAAGDFGVLRWNGSYWEALGPSPLNPVEILLVQGDHLYAGGGFLQEIDNEVLQGVARWDGEKWHSLGSGIAGTVSALQPYGDVLIAAGSFLRADGLEVRNVAAWDGDSWQSVGFGLDGFTASSMNVLRGELFVGRDDPFAGEDVAHWDGRSWREFGNTSGIGGNGIRALAAYHNTLVAGGSFSEIGERDAANLARWDGHRWMPFGSGTPPVKALLVQGDHLIVASDCRLLRWEE